MKRTAMMLLFLTLPGCANSMAGTKALHPGVAANRSAPNTMVAASESHTPVMVAAEVLHGFDFLYQNIQNTEFVLCLEGTRRSNRIHVTGFRLAVLTRTTIGSASYQPCASANYIGTAHNHPPAPAPAELCAQSPADYTSFNNDQRAVVDIILCGNTTYLWVLKDGRSGLDREGMTRLRQLLARTQ